MCFVIIGWTFRISSLLCYASSLLYLDAAICNLVCENFRKFVIFGNDSLVSGRTFHLFTGTFYLERALPKQHLLELPPTSHLYKTSPAQTKSHCGWDATYTQRHCKESHLNAALGQIAHTTRPFSEFCSIKQLEDRTYFFSPLDGMLVYCRVTPPSTQAFNLLVPIYISWWRESHCDS